MTRLDPGTDAGPAYRSIPCRLGVHPTCTEADPEPAPKNIPVTFETCACGCHTTPPRNVTSPAVPR
jgi:hypothetical protein